MDTLKKRGGGGGGKTTNLKSNTSDFFFPSKVITFILEPKKRKKEKKNSSISSYYGSRILKGLEQAKAYRIHLFLLPSMKRNDNTIKCRQSKRRSTNLKFDRDGTKMVHETQEQNRKSFHLIWVLNFCHCSTFPVYLG